MLNNAQDCFGVDVAARVQAALATTHAILATGAAATLQARGFVPAQERRLRGVATAMPICEIA